MFYWPQHQVVVRWTLSTSTTYLFSTTYLLLLSLLPFSFIIIFVKGVAALNSPWAVCIEFLCICIIGSPGVIIAGKVRERNNGGGTPRLRFLDVKLLFKGSLLQLRRTVMITILSKNISLKIYYNKRHTLTFHTVF